MMFAVGVGGATLIAALCGPGGWCPLGEWAVVFESRDSAEGLERVLREGVTDGGECESSQLLPVG